MADHEFPPLDSGTGGFEKRVHQKMTDMELIPSDAVWEKVDQRLHPQNNNRRWFIWLLFLLAALGTGGYMFWNPDTSSDISKTQMVSKNKSYSTEKEKNPLSSEKKEIRRGTPSSQTLESRSLNSTSNEKENNTSNIEKTKSSLSAKSPQKSIYKSNAASVTNKSPDSVRLKSIVSVAKGSGKPIGEVSRKVEKINSDKEDNDKKNLPTTGQELDLQKRVVETIDTVAAEKDNARIEIESVSTREPELSFVKSMLIPGSVINTSLGLINEYPLTNMSNIQSVIQLKPSYRLSWGLILMGGKSTVSSGSINSLFQNSSAAFYSNNALPAGNVNLPVPSALKAGPALKAGVFVKRQLNARLSISAGLNYNLFTLSNQVGKKVDSSITLRGALFADQKAIEEFFQTGNAQKYVSRYHFIELPVLLNAKLTANDRIPVSLDLGFSLSRLVSSNALHYDANSGIYYNDNDLFNKTQFNLLAGLPIKFFTANKLSFDAGPYFQYGLTNLLSNQQTSSKHFIFLGIKAGILLKKK